MRSLDISLWVAPCVKIINDAGLDVHPSQDFDEVKRMFPQTGRSAQTPMMDISRQDFTQSNAFWIFLTEGSDPIGGMGVKYVDLGDEGFESYLRRTSREQYNYTRDPILSIARPVTDRLTRRLIYFGELELLPGKRGSPRVLGSFAKLAKALAVMQWPEFEWMYAFIPDEHYPLLPVYGFSYQTPNAITWVEPAPTGRLNTHWIIAEDRHSFAHAAEAERLGLVEQRPK